MASIFTKIINGEIPGRFVWKDERCVAIMTIAPVRPGHVLVIPREEVDHWIDLEPSLAAHLMNASQVIGRAIQSAFNPVKVGVAVVGLEVNHVHIHLIPINEIGDLDFSRQDTNARPEDLDAAAEKIRAELRRMGRGEVA